MTGFVVAALYKFARLEAPGDLRAPLQALCCGTGVRGTLLLAFEGINGTIAGTRAGVDAVVTHLRGLPGLSDLQVKESRAASMPFARMKVRVKREIVTLGVPEADPVEAVGSHVAPGDWNSLIEAEDVALIDTRNAYEVAIGSFEVAIDPRTGSFSEFPDWWRANRRALEGRRVAMFCTGGIRCEKATSLLVKDGVREVFHLRGGVLKYLEEIPPERSLWRGECFVFDGRVSVGHGLAPGDYRLCHACGRPVSEADRRQAVYEPGVSCRACIGEYSDLRREGFRERQRQVALAAARGARHLGGG